MPEYQLEIKQTVDYPRCRIYRGLIRELIGDRNIRTNGDSGLFHYTVLCSYVNFRTSYRNLDGITYTVFPGEWACCVTELRDSLRTYYRRMHEAVETLSSILWGYTSRETNSVLKSFFLDEAWFSTDNPQVFHIFFHIN